MEEPVTSQPGPIDAYDYGYEAPKQMPGAEKSGHLSGSLSLSSYSHHHAMFI